MYVYNDDVAYLLRIPCNTDVTICVVSPCFYLAAPKNPQRFKCERMDY